MSRGTASNVESRNVELVGAAEAAEILNVPRSSVARWTKSGKFPKPLAILRATPVWRTEDIEAFKATRKPRKPAEVKVEA